MELFVAIDVSHAFGRVLVKAQQDIARLYQDKNMAEAVNLSFAGGFHLTLRYLGEVGNVQAVVSELASIRFKPFFLETAGMGFFPEHQPPVLWAGVSGRGRDIRGLRELKQAVDHKMAKITRVGEEYSFVPHITLAYGDQSGSGLGKKVRIENAGMQVASFNLYEVKWHNQEPQFKWIHSFYGEGGRTDEQRADHLCQ